MEHVKEKRDVCKDLVGEPDAKGPIGKARHRWEGVDCCHVVQDINPLNTELNPICQ